MVYYYHCDSSLLLNIFFYELFLLNKVLFVNVAIVDLNAAKLLGKHLKRKMC